MDCSTMPNAPLPLGWSIKEYAPFQFWPWEGRTLHAVYRLDVFEDAFPSREEAEDHIYADEILFLEGEEGVAQC